MRALILVAGVTLAANSLVACTHDEPSACYDEAGQPTNDMSKCAAPADDANTIDKNEVRHDKR